MHTGLDALDSSWLIVLCGDLQFCRVVKSPDDRSDGRPVLGFSLYLQAIGNVWPAGLMTIARSSDATRSMAAAWVIGGVRQSTLPHLFTRVKEDRHG
jgi:hypothetical protein